MKMAMIVYNEAIDDEVMEAMEKCGLTNYTKITGVFGKGTASGTHLGTDIWPGRNNLLYVACEDEHVDKMLSCIQALNSSFGHEGIKAFVMPLEEVT